MKAWSYMDDLQELLEQEKSNCLTNRGAAHHVDRSKSPMEDRMSQSWKDLSWQIKQGEDKINSILSDLAKSESSMKELPASKKDDRIHARFSSLRAEAYSVMNLIMDCMKINCDEKQSCISVYLHQLELATSSQPLS
ncbi:uncharacterized protein [Rutidosis leptorrhynchoides]|uniref:uncharacterized protein n=1 Tax=Rutidosis leptorrhynchoides TaxID=125765 RepID=UPI003A9A0755